jgi:CheY-like chemotaxis protein
VTRAGARISSVGPIDIGLPVMDGFALAQHLRELPELQSTPLVALTGYGQLRDREAFAAHLVKPVDAGRLRAVLDEC